MENNNINTQTEGNNTQQTAGENTESKTVTQEEVNRIVQDRLAREREKRGAGQTLEERELDLTRRENRMKCAEKLTEAGYPKELLDILDTSNAETFMENVGKLAAMQIQAPNAAPIPRVVGVTPGALKEGEDADIRKAFGLN